MARVFLSRKEIDEGALPNLCMRCGQPATLIESKRFYWGLNWQMRLLFLSAACGGPLFWVPLLLIPTRLRQVHVPVPLCQRHRNHWLPLQIILFAGIGIPAILIFLMIVFGTIACSLDPQTPQARSAAGIAVWLFPPTLAIVLMTVFPAFILDMKSIRVTLIDDQSIHLIGVAREFAERLQEGRRKGSWTKPEARESCSPQRKGHHSTKRKTQTLPPQ